jgi:uncharacterized protein YjbI with pentapeptide repeats
MKRKELINRWNTKNLEKIIVSLKKGDDFSLIHGVEKHEDRLDLRGINFFFDKSENVIAKNNEYQISHSKRSIKFVNVKFSSIDFSFCDLRNSYFENCKFENCVFKQTNMKNCYIVSSSFYDSFFYKCNLSYSFLNTNKGNNSGSFENVIFSNVNFSESRFNFPIIKKCEFIDCNLYATNFDGSQFEDCIFKGLVDSCWFRGYSTLAHKPLINLFSSFKPEKIINKMENIDFSNAKLMGVNFSYSIDLSKCMFPDTDNYILIKDLKNTFEHCKIEITTKWERKDAEMALLLINNIYYKEEKFKQKTDFIDTFPVTTTDPRFDNKFFDLIRKHNN